MSIVNKSVLRGFELKKGDYFKTPYQNNSILNHHPIHFIPQSEKTKEWKAMVADYYEEKGLIKVSDKYHDIMKNRHLAAGILDLDDYIVGKREIDTINKNISDKNYDNSLYEFHPLIPNLINLFTGYQLKRNSKIFFKLSDPDSEAEFFKMKDEDFKGTLSNILNNMKLQSLYEAGLTPENEGTKEKFFSEMESHQQLVESQLKFVKYKDIAVEWANRVHDINYKKFNIRNLIKQAFKDSYLCSSEVLFHLNMKENNFNVEHIDEALSFNGVCNNSVYKADSSHIGWFKWVNIPELINEFGHILKQEDIDKLKVYQEAMSTMDISLTGMFSGGLNSNNHATSAEGYDATKSYDMNTTATLDMTLYKRRLEKEYGITFTNQTIYQTKPNINPNFKYGDDKMFRIMYLYVNSQKKLGWLRKINKVGEIEYDDWVTEDFIQTVDPIYDLSKTTEKSAKNLVYGEHIDWEWKNDWRRFIKITPNAYNNQYSTYGKGLDCLYLDGESLAFQFSSQRDPFEVKPPIIGIEIKMRGVKTVPLVKLLKPDQITYNICRNRIKQVLAEDRGIVLAYSSNLVSRFNNDTEDDGQLLKNYENKIRETKTLVQTYDKAFLQGAGGQMSAPTVLNLSTIGEAVQYDQLAERTWYNALRTVGVTPQAMGEIKASEEVTNARAAQQISQVQTEILFDEFNSRLLPELYQRMLEASQYYCTINEESRLLYLNSNEENTWLDITGTDILHKDFQCIASYEFDNQEFSDLVKRLAFDNTLQESLTTRLKIIAEATKNPGKVISILEESEEKARLANAEMERIKQEQQIQAFENEQLLKDKELAAESEKNKLDRLSKEYIAQLNVLGGGLQTDSNQNKEIDSYENLKNVLKDKELQQNSTLKNKALDIDNSNNTIKQQIEREKLASNERIAAMKLKESIINRNKYSDKNIESKVIKK